VKVYYPKFSREEIVSLMKKRIKALSKMLPLKAVVLFGSYAEGRFTAASDIDILIVYEGSRRKDVYKICWDTINIPQAELHIYSSHEYDALKKSKSFFPSEIDKKGIVIWGSIS